MSTTLTIESFNEVNIRERTLLTAVANPLDITLIVASTQDYAAGDIIYIGNLSREGCEKAVIASVDDAATLTLDQELTLPHARFDAVTSVLGDLIHVYRAANIDGSVPDVSQFTVLATRTIDCDQLSTYYTDSAGSSNFWYGYTYFNASTSDETQLDPESLRRGDDFGHYASLAEIRKDAGLDNALNLSDVVIDQQRRAAESRINTALGNRYSTPFNPVPDIIATITIKVAAGYLLNAEYPGSKLGDTRIAEAEKLMTALQNGDQTIVDENGNATTTGEGIASWPDDTAPRAFIYGDRW